MSDRKLLELVNPESLMPPIGFAHACIVNSGRQLHLAGQVAADKSGQIQHRGDLVKQFDLAFQNFKTCMDAAGARMDQVVKLNYYVIDVPDYLAKLKELGPIYRKYFGRHFPAMTLVGVAGQSMFVHFAVIDFARSKEKGDQPDITIEMVVYDKDKKPTLVSPTKKAIPDEADGKVDPKIVGVPMRFLVPLNREGDFLIELKATDNVSKKVSQVYLPLRVFPAVN